MYHSARSIAMCERLQATEHISNSGKVTALGSHICELVERRDGGSLVRDLVRSQIPVETAVPIDNGNATLGKFIPWTPGIKFAAICAKHIPDAIALKFTSKASKLIADRVCDKLRTIDASQKCLVVIATIQQQGCSLRSPNRDSAKGHEQKRTYRELHGKSPPLASNLRLAYESATRIAFRRSNH
jgi:hypothetical protein